MSIGVNQRTFEFSTKGTSRTQFEQQNDPGFVWANRLDGKSTLPSLTQVGSTDELTNRTYDDGYVALDPNTTREDAVGQGHTWNWGYDNPSQFDQAADTLSFNSTFQTTDDRGSRARDQTTTVTTQRGTSSSSQIENRSSSSNLRNDFFDRSAYVDGHGISFQAGGDFYDSGPFSIGLFGGFNTAWGAEKTFALTPYEETFRRDRVRITDHFETEFQTTHTEEYFREVPSQIVETTITDVYNLSGVVPPSAPYRGSFNGPGPLISNLPASRSQSSRTINEGQRIFRLLSSDTSQGASEIIDSSQTRENITSETFLASAETSFDISSDLYDFQFGPVLRAQISSRMDVYLSPFISLNYVDAEVVRTENLVSETNGQREILNTWRERDSDSDLLWGYGAKIGGRVNLLQDWFLQADFSINETDSLTFDNAYNQIEIAPSEYSVQVMFGKRFKSFKNLLFGGPK